MNTSAAWSAQATPLAKVAGALVFTLGAFSLVLAALMLALGGADWTFPAYACMALTAVLVVLRLRSLGRVPARELTWDAAADAFRVAGFPACPQLVSVWRGPGWVTLGLRHQAGSKRVMRLVVWKSAVSAPSWSELALRIEAAQFRGNGHQNKENP